MNGYTEQYYATCGAVTLRVSVEPGADLDSRVRAWCHDTGEFLHLSGWMCTWEKVPGVSNKQPTPRELGESFARDGRPIDSHPYRNEGQEDRRQEFYAGYAQYLRRTQYHR